MLALTALVASLALQLIMGVVAMLPAAILAGVKAGMQGITDIARIETMVMEEATGAAAWGVLLYHVISLPVFWVWYYFGCGRVKLGNPLKILKGKVFGVVLIAGFGMNLLANGVAMCLQFLAPEVYANYVELMEAAGMGENPLAILAAVILAPIGEELLCRGIILYYGMKMATGAKNENIRFWIANILQAFLFGVMHANLVQGTYAFILGLGLGMLCRRYHSIYPAMLGHFVINFLSSFVMGLLFGWVPESPVSAAGLLIAGTGICALTIFFAKEKKMQ